MYLLTKERHLEKITGHMDFHKSHLLSKERKFWKNSLAKQMSTRCIVKRKTIFEKNPGKININDNKKHFLKPGTILGRCLRRMDIHNVFPIKTESILGRDIFKLSFQRGIFGEKEKQCVRTVSERRNNSQKSLFFKKISIV